MSKLNEFFEKKKQKSKGLGDLSGTKKPIIGGLKVATGDPSVSSVISEGNIDDWLVSTEVKESSDFILSSKNLSMDGLRKSTNSQMVVAVKTSKPDFDSNIWKSKTGDSSGAGGPFSLGKNSGEEEAGKGNSDEKKDKPKETLKYNVRARLAARGQKVDFLNARDAINSMPTLAAAVANTNKPKGLNLAPLHPENSQSSSSGTAEPTAAAPPATSTEGTAEKPAKAVTPASDHHKDDSSGEAPHAKDKQGDERSDLEVIRELRSCNLLYFNKDVLFNCTVDIEQSKLKYSNIVRDF